MTDESRYNERWLRTMKIRARQKGISLEEQIETWYGE